MELVLGVLDVAYSDASAGGATTTGEVAQILEDRYHVMMTFYESRKEKIDGWLAQSVANAIETMVSSGRHVSLTFDAEQMIEAEFRAFLSANEMGRLSFLTEAERLLPHARPHLHGGRQRRRLAPPQAPVCEEEQAQAGVHRHRPLPGKLSGMDEGVRDGNGR